MPYQTPMFYSMRKMSISRQRRRVPSRKTKKI
nr:MAG TPA: hypothetical protein [Caudoviricetes sp.]